MADPRVLLVDDQRQVTRMLRSSLELSGRSYDILDVASAEEALREMERGPVDLVVTDLRLPEMSGLELIARIRDKTISGKLAKQVFEAMWDGQGSADRIIAAKGLKQVTDVAAISAVIREVLANSPKQLEQYRGGQEKLFGYFVGQVMQASQGKANPAQVNQLLRSMLDES